MKQLSGIPYNINETILGVITFSSKIIFSRNKYIIVDKKYNSNLKGYAAILTHKREIESYHNKIVYNIENIDLLKDGDIVTIDKNGIINILFDINSYHNSLYITGKCNSNCIMCSQPPVNNEVDRFKMNLKFISLINKKNNHIGISGGEPTLIGDKLFTIIEKINKQTPNTTIDLLTNGIRFANFEYAKKAAQMSNKNVIFEIPIHSDIDTIHDRIVNGKSFYKTIKGIYNLAKFDFKIGIRVVIHKINYERLPELSEFIYTNFPFIYRIAFMQMEPIGYAKDNIEDLWIDPYDYHKQLEQAVLNLYLRDINVNIYNSQLCILPDTIKRFAADSISDWKKIYIEECDGCLLKEKCPGFFVSAKNIHSRKINAIRGF